MSSSIEQSKAHRLFFIKATSRGVFELRPNDYWDAKLCESGALVLQRFIEEGLIEQAPIDAVISNLFTIVKLKPHLKARNLKVGGKKGDLVARIIAADPVWAQDITKGEVWHRRSVKGQRLADAIYDSIGAEQGETEARLTSLIHDGKYKEAHRAWVEWDAKQVFPRDAWCGVDNRKADSSVFIQMAQSITSKLPVGYRERVILDMLLGRANYDPIEMEAQHGAAYERDLLDYRRTWGVAGIKIDPGNQPCKNAMQYAGCYRLENAPDYPFGPCEMTGPEYEDFCTCWWQCIFGDEKPADGWKVPKKRHPLAGPHIEVMPDPPTQESVDATARLMSHILGVEIKPPKLKGLWRRMLERFFDN